MRQKRQILILLIILAALAALYGGLRMWNKKSEDRKAEEAEAKEIRIIPEDEYVSLSYTNGTDEMRFVKGDGEWYYEEDQEIPMSQSTVEGIASSISGLTAVRKLEEPDALGDYGLEEPAYTICLTDGDGKEYALYIGNAAEENYYARTDEAGDVYTITDSIISALNFDLSSLVQYDTVPSIGSGNLKKVEVIQSGESTVYEDEEELGELAGGIGTLTLSDCMDYHVQEENLTEYGLDEKNRVTVNAVYEDSATDQEETFTVYVGSMDDSGSNYYIMVKDSKMVYQVSEGIVENMLTVSGDQSS